MSGTRQPRMLDVSKKVKSSLLQLRTLQGEDNAPEVELRTVVDVEQALGCAFSDDVLAVFAAGVAFDLAATVDSTTEARARGLADDLVVVGGERADDVYVAVRGILGKDDEDRVFLFHGDDRTATTATLVAWLETRVREVTRRARDEEREEDDGDGDGDRADDRSDDRGDDDAPAPRGRSAAAKPAFAPALVGLRATNTPRFRVTHKTFGIGEVVRTIGTGDATKLEIEFPVGVGTKLLLARFVERLETP